LSRVVTVAAAQLGPIQRAEDRASVVARMDALLEAAIGLGADLVAFPELALTTFFPRWVLEGPELEAQYEAEEPPAVIAPLIKRARAAQVALTLGYAERTPEGRRFNTAILLDRDGRLVLKYRKVHLPGHAEPDPERAFQHLEKRYFEPGDLGFPTAKALGGRMGLLICNDRRWPEAWRVLGLQGVELVALGYNTPSVNSQKAAEGPGDRLFHHRLSVQAGAYQNATWAVAVAKAGVEDGHPLIGGSLIVDPDGRIVAESETEGDELLVHACDLDACAFGKTTIFDFARHRRPEHYGPIVSQTGVVEPD
jgi:predicted amidohydrolase